MLQGSPGFNKILNQEQLNKVLLDLLTKNYATAIELGVESPSSAEFKAYFVLMCYGGLPNKGGVKHPNKRGADNIIRRFTQEEKVGGSLGGARVARDKLCEFSTHGRIAISRKCVRVFLESQKGGACGLRNRDLHCTNVYMRSYAEEIDYITQRAPCNKPVREAIPMITIVRKLALATVKATGLAANPSRNPCLIFRICHSPV